MSFQRTRPPGDTLQVLLAFIHQEEGASNALLQVVAGTQNGAPFNLTEFQFTTENLPAVSFTPVTQPIDTSDQQDAVRAQIEAGGKTLLFFAPIFDQSSAPGFDPNLAPMIAVCRDGPVAAITPVEGVSMNVPAPGVPVGAPVQSTTPPNGPVAAITPVGGVSMNVPAPGVPVNAPVQSTTAPNGPVAAITPVGGVSMNVPAPGVPVGAPVQSTTPLKPDPTSGEFHGNSSSTTGLAGTATTFADGTVVKDGTETLTAVRRRSLGSKPVRQVRTKKGAVEVVQQADYCWQPRQLSDAILVENFPGFPPGTKFRTGKATEFGKHDPTDEGTGSEFLKVVQTNSEVFGCSLKQSILAAAFGTPLGSKPDLLRAQVEIFHPAKKRFARVPIVDVGPAERLEAVIDLTFALDKFLGTDGSAKVQFRIVV
jgi:hypothetical protein